MQKIYSRFHIGLRTVKTVIAVVLSMVIVDSYGTTDSKLVFAMLGAMAAMQPTFKDSLESCLTQIVGVLFGGVMGALLRMLPVPQLAATALGLMLVIVLYNALRIRFSPSLPCFIVVMVCITPSVAPMQYAFGRVWDSAIGLAVGMLINTLVFPYDNSRMIRKTVENLDRELLRFMEKMAGYNAVLPDVSAMEKYMSDLTSQLNIFSRQKFFTRARWQSGKLAELRRCESYARELIAHLEVLSVMKKAGALNEENREKLKAIGTLVCESSESVSAEADLITNYHVSQILRLRQELLSQIGV
ncbi:MAG: FUSC family protein [Clostridia bacterium]|nr:FUSC family protein [Clostridia bacterium]